MDRASLIRQAVARVWGEFSSLMSAGTDEPLDTLLLRLAEESLRLTVDEDVDLIGTNIEGTLETDDGLILLRPGLPPMRRRFVLAHEIGHYVLRHPARRIFDESHHFNEAATAADLSDERQRQATGLDLPADRAIAALRGYSERDRWEMEANAFAAELLAPMERLAAAVLSEPKDWSVTELSARFGVPMHLIRAQLVGALLPGISEAGKEEAEAGDAPPSPARSAPVISLDKSQEKAATIDAPALIVAGPGAGKTRVLVERFAYLVSEKEADPRRILALTFANKAAGEMRERLAARIGEADAPAIEVATFHAWGLQMLQEYGHHIGLKMPLRLVTPLDALVLLRPHIARLPLGGFEDLKRPLHQVSHLLSAISRAKDEAAGPQEWEERAKAWLAAVEADPDATSEAKAQAQKAMDAAAFYAAYQTLLRENGYLDYGDLLFEALHLFDIPEVADDIRARYDHVLVDEFQDINYISGRLVRALDGGRGIVWAVGDPKQSIYGFRGASPVNLARFSEADYYPGAPTVHLEYNYRSLPGIVAAGQAVAVPLPGAEDAAPPVLRAHRQGDGGDSIPVEAVSAAAQSGELRAIADRIGKLREEGTSLADMAVLCRTRAQSQTVGDALTAAGIPHTWGGALEHRVPFKTLMGALLLAADDPLGIARLTMLVPELRLSEADRRALLSGNHDYQNVDGSGPSARRLIAAAVSGNVLGLSADGICRLKRLREIAHALSPTAGPFHNLCVYLFDHAGWFRALLLPENRATSDGRRTLATLGQTMALAASFAGRQAVIGAEDDSTTAFLEWARAALEAGGLGVPDELSIAGGEAVNVLTAHRSKGLEWPVVFVPFLAADRFPARPREAEVPLPPGLIHDAEEADEETADTETRRHEREESCLFYVAATRARDRLVLTRSRRYPGPRRPSPSPYFTALCAALRPPGFLTETEIEEDEDAAVDEEATVTAAFLPVTLPDPVPYAHLDMYGRCPQRYLYQYVYSLADAERAYSRFHSVVYDVMGWVRDEAAAGRSVVAEAAQAKLASLWEERGPSPSHWYEPMYRRTAEGIVSAFQERLMRHAGGSTAAGSARLTLRETVTVSLDGRRRVTVRIDEAENAPGGTGDAPTAPARVTLRRCGFGRPPKNPPVDDRMALYSLWAQEALPPAQREQAAVCHHYPRYGESVPVQITERVRQNRVRKLLTVMESIERGEFTPRPHPRNCLHCPYFLACPGGEETGEN